MNSFIFLLAMSTGREQNCRDLNIWKFEFFGEKKTTIFYDFLCMVFSIFCWKKEVSTSCSFEERKNLKISNFEVIWNNRTSMFITSQKEFITSQKCLLRHRKNFFNCKINFFNVSRTRCQIEIETSSHMVATYWQINFQGK